MLSGVRISRAGASYSEKRRKFLARSQLIPRSKEGKKRTWGLCFRLLGNGKGGWNLLTLFSLSPKEKGGGERGGLMGSIFAE